MATKIISYKNIKEAQHDIKSKERKGWTVESIQQGSGRHGFGKTAAIGATAAFLINILWELLLAHYSAKKQTQLL